MSHTTQLNPYGASTTILDPEQFFGRTEELHALYGEILSRRCVSIVGTRRVGKSSLLRCMCLPEVQQRFMPLYDLSKHLLVFIDLGEFLSKTSEDFFEAVSMQLLVQSRGRLALDVPEAEYGSDRFCELLDQIQEKGFHTVLLFDAFHKITRNMHFDPKFFSFMRAQANHGRVSYITASIIPLEKCCHPYIEGSPFFNIFKVMRLGPLAMDEARQLITAPALATNTSFTNEEVERILLLAGRHPFFIHQVASHIFREKYHSYSGQTKIKYEIYHDLLPQFKDIWENSLDAKQREMLREEAHWKQPRPGGKLSELSESELFRKFVRDTCNVEPVDITAEHLEELLNKLHNTKFLGESELTYLSLFFMRTQKGGIARSANEKGIIVRRILQEARDRLRPPGEQNNTAPEWQFFNILNYRYFKDHIRNEFLADLLGISLRQLHRERALAIEALRDALGEMEVEAREELEM